MDTKTETKKTGNFGRPTKPVYEKDLRFKLVNNFDKLKPVDAATGEPAENPYPAIHIVANSGVAYDEKKGEYRRWRYLDGYPSIWEDEQTNPKPSINQLTSEKNDIIFLKGFITVKKQNHAKIQALFLNDAFAGNTNPVNEIPKVFELIDETAQFKSLRKSADDEFNAESKARNCSVDEMLPIAQLYGIDTTEDPDIVRTHFILKSKQNPPKFLENFNNPKFKAKYTITEGLRKGLIEVKENKLIYLESGQPLFEVNGSADVAEQVALMVLREDPTAVTLVEKLNENLR